MKNDAIKQSILNVGLKNWPDISARAIGRDLGIAHTNVLYHFNDIETLKDAIAREAVRVGNSQIIAQLIVARHDAVKEMDAMTKALHLQSATV